jgi:hypothetical protein
MTRKEAVETLSIWTAYTTPVCCLKVEQAQELVDALNALSSGWHFMKEPNGVIRILRG